MYAKLEDGVLKYAPKNYTNEEGQIIVNFNKNETIMRQYAYKEVIDVKPIYDKTTQYLQVDNYEETDTEIIIVYEIIDKAPKPTLDERIANLEQQLNNMSIIFDEEVNK